MEDITVLDNLCAVLVVGLRIECSAERRRFEEPDACSRVVLGGWPASELPTLDTAESVNLLVTKAGRMSSSA